MSGKRILFIFLISSFFFFVICFFGLKKKFFFLSLLFASPSFSSRGTMATLTSTTPIFVGKFNPLASPYEDTKIVAMCDALDIELRFIRHVVVDLPRSRVIVATRLYLYIIDIGEYLLCTSSSSKAKVKNNSALSSSASSLSSSSSSVIEKKAGRVKQFVIHECCDAICAVALDGNSGDVLVSWLDCNMSSRLAGTQRIDVLGNNTYYSFESYEYMIWFPGFNTVAHRARHAHHPFSYDSLELAQLMRKQEEKEEEKEDNDENNHSEKKEGNEEHEHPTTTTTTTTTKQIRAGIIGHIHDDCVLSRKAVLVYSTVCCDGTYSSVTSIPPKQCGDLDSKITHLAYFGANTLVATSSSQRHIRFLEVAFLSKEKRSVQSATSSSSESSRAEKKGKSKENVTQYSSSSSSSLVRRSRIVAGRDLTSQEKEMEEKIKYTGHISATHLIIDGRGDCAVFACPIYSRVVNCERIFVADQGCIRVVTPLFLNDSCSKGSRASWLGQHPWTADTVMVSTIAWTNFHDTVFDMIGHGTALMSRNRSTLHLVEWSTQRDIQETFDANFSRLLPLSLVALISEYTCAY